MREAIKLAQKGRGRTSPNPLVGAVVVREERIVGRGYHAYAGGPHAEINALKEAGPLTEGATLYVNLEPCCHYGKTPPCTKSIIVSKIGRVVAAMGDPNPLVRGKGFEELSSAGIEIKVGVLEKEAQRLNEIFIKYITTKRPFVILKAAMSLDGKIATVRGESHWITGERARAYVHRLRDEVDAILVGINTVLKDDPRLTTRIKGGKGKDPIRIVVDSHLRIPPTAKVLEKESKALTIIATTKSASGEKIGTLENLGARVLLIEEKDGRVSLNRLIETLGELEITSVLIEGGGEINASALRAGIVDKVLFFIAPKIIGGRVAPGPVGGKGMERIEEALNLRDVSLRRIGPDILVEGYLVK